MERHRIFAAISKTKEKEMESLETVGAAAVRRNCEFERTCASRDCSRPQEVQRDGCTDDLITFSLSATRHRSWNQVELRLFTLRFVKFGGRDAP